MNTCFKPVKSSIRIQFLFPFLFLIDAGPGGFVLPLTHTFNKATEWHNLKYNFILLSPENQNQIKDLLPFYKDLLTIILSLETTHPQSLSLQLLAGILTTRNTMGQPFKWKDPSNQDHLFFVSLVNWLFTINNMYSLQPCKHFIWSNILYCSYELRLILYWFKKTVNGSTERLSH